jgi:hypothetical protein
VPSGICQEDVGAAILALEATLELARQQRQGCEIGLVSDVHHEIDVFRARAVAQDRPDERDALNA